MRSYDEAIIDAAISIYSSKQIGNADAAIQLAEYLVDALVEAKYVDPPEDESNADNHGNQPN